jgi:uncharacterized protein YdeI (YjbR/CyaY-like superfamily)
MTPLFFETADAFREWLAANHGSATELWVGFHKKGSGLPSMTWPESVDEALCTGWIDGVRKGIDAASYMIRFSPRKTKSNWSAVNIKRVTELIAAGRMLPAGRKAFESRLEEKSAVYSYEQRHQAAFDPRFERQFRANESAWRYFQTQPPGYRHTATHWVMTAKKEETRLRRLAVVIERSATGRRIDLLSPSGTKNTDSRGK